ncbi:hypothetical protein BpHYR1_052707 [Brachionus plicatilis]|uniref:Uncharacterized protein n=1 Tax=Brachionus plicatilis TaxID=10195 RepID=A0A3M7SKD1_BRAPC|nr:hypothetical protein BpHYR1_052707 [Brachionus plicatilis]
MLVFHVKDVKTGFVEIVCQRVSNKIIHFIVQTTIAFFNFIGQFLILYSCAFFDHSDMSHCRKKIKFYYFTLLLLILNKIFDLLTFYL